MALLCYNRGCGDRFDEENNSDGKDFLFSILLMKLESLWIRVSDKML